MSTSNRALLGGGCFWCTEAIYADLRGVLSVKPAYTGGRTEHPTYEDVCTGTTGHAEIIDIEFDPAVISYRTLLEIFFATHNPTTLNRQGNDIGTQYRSAVFVLSDEQADVARDVRTEAQDMWDDPIVTEIVPAGTVYAAESYHEDYFANNPNQPYCAAVINPKVQKFRQQYGELLRDS